MEATDSLGLTGTNDRHHFEESAGADFGMPTASAAPNAFFPGAPKPSVVGAVRAHAFFAVRLFGLACIEGTSPDLASLDQIATAPRSVNGRASVPAPQIDPQ